MSSNIVNVHYFYAVLDYPARSEEEHVQPDSDDLAEEDFEDHASISARFAVDQAGMNSFLV